MPLRSKKTNETPVTSDQTQQETTSFKELNLSDPILNAIDEMGYKQPTQIQEAVIPLVLQKQDIVGIARTGTGKTASFTLPILETLSKTSGRARMPRALILEPTRELAVQVVDNIKQYSKYLKLSHVLLVGGESIADQKENLRRGGDIIIATPGRLIDLIEKGAILLNQIRLLVIDEADRMLDMGFIPDIEKIISFLPKARQTLLLSATMPAEIKKLADSFLTNPREITISPPSSVATTIDAKLVILPETMKRKALRALLKKDKVKNAIIFCNRKKDVDILTRSLKKHHFQSAALHGDIAQHYRTKTMEDFKNGKIKYLVCSDIAARGIDVEDLSHVFNYDIPHQAEDYVHRIGRTGRAGKTGYAYNFATPEEAEQIQAIEALIKETIPVIQIEALLKPDVELDSRNTETRQTEKETASSSKTRERKPAKGTTRNRRTSRKHDDIPVPRIPLSQSLTDHDIPTIGFGQFVPAFMLSPFRRHS